MIKKIQRTGDRGLKGEETRGEWDHAPISSSPSFMHTSSRLVTQSAAERTVRSSVTVESSSLRAFSKGDAIGKRRASSDRLQGRDGDCSSDRLQERERMWRSSPEQETEENHFSTTREQISSRKRQKTEELGKQGRSILPNIGSRENMCA